MKFRNFGVKLCSLQSFKNSSTTRPDEQDSSVYDNNRCKVYKDGGEFSETGGVKQSKDSKKIIEALDLPIICNINPRSIYNKIDQFETFVIQNDVDVVFMSESWEREDNILEKVVHLENYDE